MTGDPDKEHIPDCPERFLWMENLTKGYMEGDRGHSFPRGYTWIQSTDFGCAASVMLALAEIPLAGLRFTGCIGRCGALSAARFKKTNGAHQRRTMRRLKCGSRFSRESNFRKCKALLNDFTG